MKKTIIKTLTFSMIASLCLFTSCQSTKTEIISNDNFTAIEKNDSSEKENIEDDEVIDCTTEDQPTSSLPIIDIQHNDGKKTLFSGNTDKFVLANEVSLFSEDALGKLKERIGTITAYPKKNLVGIGSQYLGGYYILFLDNNSGDTFSNAVTSYLRDFENKKLERKNSKSFKKYGSTNATLYWGVRKTSTPNYGTGKILFGYTFINKSPYFAITCFPVLNEYCNIDDEAARESVKLTYYFTKAQAKELSSFLTNKSIDNILYQINNQNTISNFGQGSDEY